MGMDKYILAHDCGTTGNKATLYNEKGELVNAAFYEYNTYYSHINWVEQNAQDWWIAVCRSTKKLIAESKIEKDKIAVITFSAQMMGCLPLNEKGEPLRKAIIWADQRSIKQAQYLQDTLGEDKVYKITGHKISSTYSLEKIMWIKENEPEIYKNTFKFVHTKDYIVKKLTGKFATDYSDASGMNLYDIKKREWSAEILETAKIEIEKLPLPHSSCDVVGVIKSSIAEEIGLKAGTPVVMGSGDGIAASVGAGVLDQGSVYNYIGASSWIALATTKPLEDPERRIFNWIHAIPNMYMPCATMQSAGASYKWLKENICALETKCAEDLGISPYKLLDFVGEKSEPTARKLIFLPYLLGERSPHWNPNALGAFIGLTLQHKRSDIVRSVMEGVTFNLKIISDIFEIFLDFDELRVIGGGAKGLIWQKIMADIYNKNILIPKILEEATSLGAAVIGGVGIGIFDDFNVVKQINPVVNIQKPDKNNVRKYEQLFPIFKKSYYALTDIYDMLSN